MKKIMIACTVVLGAVLFASCNKIEAVSEETTEPVVKMATLTASIESETKTSLDGVNVYWSDNDAVGVFSNTAFTKTVYTSNNSGTGTKKTVFIGEEKSGERFLALYPASQVSLSGSNVSIPVATTQTYVEDGIANNLLTMAAYGTSLDEMNFIYLGGIVRIKLYADEAGVLIKSIRLVPNGNSTTLIAPVYSRAFDSAYPNATGAGGLVVGDFTLNCGNKELSTDPENPTVFNIVFGNPATCTGGFDLTITRSNNDVMSVSKPSSFSFVRGKIHTFPKLLYAADAIDANKQINVDNLGWETLATCTKTPTTSVAVQTESGHSLTSGDVDLVLAIVNKASSAVPVDLSGAEYISSTFRTISSTKIRSFSLPNNIQRLQDYAFTCANMTSVDLTTSTVLNYIGTYAFDGTKITSLFIPKTVSSIGGWIAHTNTITAFEVEAGSSYFKAVDGVLFTKDGSQLVEYPVNKSGTSYSVPSGVTNIKQAGFRGKNLTSVTFPASLSKIEAYNFTNQITELSFNNTSSAPTVNPGYLRSGTGTTPETRGGIISVPSGKKEMYTTKWSSWLTGRKWVIDDGTGE